MKKLPWAFVLSSAILFTGCQRNSNTVWEDTKTMGRYLHRQGQLLWKQDANSRMINSEEEFVGPQGEEYIPLRDEDLKTQFADHSIPQPKEVPGAIGSSIPSIEYFSKPTSKLANLFQNVYFKTDQHTPKSDEDRKVLSYIAEHMKKNPHIYLTVEGYCDERASEAYNLALGTRRANAIRNHLIQNGVNPNHIFPISYGKEKPAELGHTEAAWAKNRRVEFKIYEKKAS